MKIEYYNRFNTITHYEPVNDAYTVKYKGNKPTRALAKYVFKILTKLASVEQYAEPLKQIEVERVVIDYRELEKMIFEHIENVRCVYNRECRMIVIGYKQLKKLGGSFNSPMSFNFPHDYNSYSFYNNDQLRFAGIEVSVVPWVDGVFAIPNK